MRIQLKYALNTAGSVYLANNCLKYLILIGCLLLAKNSLAKFSIEEIYPSNEIVADGCNLIITTQNYLRKNWKKIIYVHIPDLYTDPDWVSVHSLRDRDKYSHKKLSRHKAKDRSQIIWYFEESQLAKDLLQIDVDQHTRAPRISIFQLKKLTTDELFIKSAAIREYLDGIVAGEFGVVYQRNYQATYNMDSVLIDKMRKLKPVESLLTSVSPVAGLDLVIEENRALDLVNAMHDFKQTCVSK